MKQIVASIGAVAIGSTALQQAQAVNLSPQESTKPWSVSVALRGFYDDNYTYQPRDSSDIPSSWGFEVRPTLGLNVPLEQTYFGLDLTYSGQWYEDDDYWQNTFLANALFNHAFSQQVTLDVQDSFVYSDRPELLDPDFSTVVRTDQNNINNRGNIALNIGLSRRLGLVLAYQNVFWDYQNDNPSADTVPPATTSLSAALDRIQQLIPVNLRYQVAPATVGFVGYSYGMVDYTSNEYLYFYNSVAQSPRADSRNYRSHYGYVGVEHNFTPVLSGGARGGVQYSDWYNLSNEQNTLTPYGDVSLTYLYTTGSQVEIGYTLSQAATDQTAPSSTGTPTLNRLASSVYGRVDHQFLPQLHGGLYAQWQYSRYYGGAYDNQNENLYLLGLTVSYQFNPFLAANLGYTLDYIDSDIPNRGYTRNRVYLGLTASY